MAVRKNESANRIRGAYTTPLPTVRYMVERLGELLPSSPGLVLDPAAGKGIFLRELARLRPEQPRLGLELNPNGAAPELPIRQGDFVHYFVDRLAGADRAEPIIGLIGNPPYNCHESPYIRQNKAQLKKIFAEIGVLNTYSMFIYAGLRLLAEGGILCMVTMDSFLTNTYHRRLRQFILAQAEIIEILLAPRQLFHRQRADVRTAILTLRKTARPDPQHPMRLVDRVASQAAYHQPSRVQTLAQKEYSALHESVFVVGVPESVRRLFRGSESTLGQRVPGGAGISTGNDRRFLRQGQPPADWVPFYKNPAGHRFFYQPDTYLTPDWAVQAEQRHNFMVRNRGFFFKEGISCSSMGLPFSAVRLPAGSLFGVNANLFPESEAERFFLLGLLNSALAGYMVRAVLNRTNMVTPGYIKKMPYRYQAGRPECEAVIALARQAYQAARAGQKERVDRLVSQINDQIFDLYDIPAPDRPLILDFVDNLYERR